MTQFYSISDNTAYKRGMPEIYEIVSGIVDQGPCPTCGVGRRKPTGDIQVIVSRTGKAPARMWPDLIACGDYPCFVMSERFLSAMRESDLRMELGGRVDFIEPNKSGLSLDDAPQYYWVDGNRCRAGKMDFETSGFVDVRFCPECGNRTDDISLTHRRQHAGPPPGYVFDFDESLGYDLFTTDISPTAFFCTDRVLECAREYRLTNLRFTPVEAGLATWSKGIDYLGKKWPPKHRLRQSEGKSLAQWVKELHDPATRYESRCAIIDLGKEAAPAIGTLIRLLDSEDEMLAREAALLLNALGKLGIDLPPKGVQAAAEYEKWFQQTLGH